VNYSLAPEAQEELMEGARRYAEMASRELGLAFIAEVERVAELLCIHPQLGVRWRGATRRFPLRRFRHSLIYLVRPDEIRIIAVAHQRRRPGYWHGRQ